MSIYLAAKTPKIFRFSKNGAKKPPIFFIADFNHILAFAFMTVNHSIKLQLYHFFCFKYSFLKSILALSELQFYP